MRLPVGESVAATDSEIQARKELLATIEAQREAAAAAIKGTAARKCSVCGKGEGGEVKLKGCAACKHPEDIYCSTDCQATAWKGGHKQACPQRKKQQTVDLSFHP